MASFIIGLSIGTSQTTTALCVLERREKATGKTELDGNKTVARSFYADTIREYYRPVTQTHYAVRHLERLGAGTPYPEQVSHTHELVTRLEKRNAHVSLIIDQTGVGRPVTDLFKATKLKPSAATVTGGDTPSREGNEHRIPKRDLVSTAQVLLQAKRLTIASSLALAPALTSELLAFKANITLSRENSAAPPEPWRERTHDDLVLAVALACWYGETHKPLLLVAPVSEYQENVWDV